MFKLCTFYAAVLFLLTGTSGIGLCDPPKRTNDEQWIQGVGYIEPATEVRRLVFNANGVIGRCYVQPRTSVRAGTVLMSLQNEDLAAAITVSEMELAQAKAEEAKVLSGMSCFEQEIAEADRQVAEAQLEVAQKNYSRTMQLLTKRTICDSEADPVQSTFKERKAALLGAQARYSNVVHIVRKEDRELAKCRVGLAQARLELARQQFTNTLLRAPCDGTILQLLKREGDSARFIDPEPAIIFADLSKLLVRAEIDEHYARFMQVGAAAIVTGRGLASCSVPGKVVAVERIMGKKTVFARTATERKDVDVIQVLLETNQQLDAPVGLEVDVKVKLSASASDALPQPGAK